MMPIIAENTLLETFVRSCLFIHDDWIPAAGRADWGAYDTNPFLLGADVCVINTLEGFGPDYLEYLRDLNSLPSQILIPERYSDNLTLNLLADEQTLARARALVQERQLDVSVFYNDQDRGLDRLMPQLATQAHTPTLYPTKTSFDAANGKIDGRRYAQMAGVPVPEGAVCQSPDDVLAFFQDRSRSAQGIMIKADHRKLLIAMTEAEVRRAAAEFPYPVLVETLYDVKASPSLNMMLWQGEQSAFVVTDQILEGRAHRGNVIPSRVSPEIVQQIHTYTARIGEAIPDLQGLFGVDYIVTHDDQVLAVDINPRFCSGTYPLNFLQRMGISLDTVNARYELVHCNVESLSTILCDPDFVPLLPGRADGIFIYDPVVYETELPVNYFSYLAVAETPARLAALETTMREVVAKYSPEA